MSDYTEATDYLKLAVTSNDLWFKDRALRRAADEITTLRHQLEEAERDRDSFADGLLLADFYSECPECGEYIDNGPHHPDCKYTDVIARARSIVDRQHPQGGEDYKALQAECEQLRKYAAFYRRLRSLTYEQLGQPGVPCVAVPEADNRGHYVAGEDLDAAMQETSHDNQ